MKTFKKSTLFLLIVLAFVIMVPVMSFAAGDGEPVTIDIEEHNSNVSLGEGKKFYDEDGYILTGENTGLNVSVYGSCSVTFRDVSMQSISFYAEDAEVNLNLEGDNFLESNIGMDLVSLYSMTLKVNGGDGDTLTGRGPASFISDTGNSSTVIINGGKITGITQINEGDNFATASFNKLIMNGGELNLSNNFSTSLSIIEPIVLNGGIVNVDHTGEEEDCEAVYGSLELCKGAVITIKSVKPENLFSIYKNIKIKDGEKDTEIFVRYDKESEFILTRDPLSAISGRTYVEIKADEHIHVYDEDSVCYCGYICTHSDVADNECVDCGKSCVPVRITLNDSYGDGWNGNELIVVKKIDGEFVEVEKLTIESGSEYIAEIYLASDDAYGLMWMKGSYASECSFTVVYDGDTVFDCEDCSDFEDEEVIHIFCDHEFEKYVCKKCKLTCGVDFEHVDVNNICSRCNNFIYRFISQPTSKKPFVSINNREGASYQWQQRCLDGEEITDKNASGEWTSGFGPVTSTYDEEKGWTNSGDSYFMIELKKGQNVIGEFSSPVDTASFMHFPADGNTVGYKFLTVDKKNRFVFTAQEDGVYALRAYDVEDGSVPEKPSVKAYVGELVYKDIENATSAVFTDYKIGNEYRCKVSCGDGFTVLLSDSFVCDYAITHQPTDEEPYVELNDAANVKYQWSNYVRKETEITDESERITYSQSLYTKEEGWTVPEDDEDGIYFTVTVEKGEKIRFVFDERIESFRFAPEGAGASSEYRHEVIADEYILTVNHAGTYNLYNVYDPTSFRAYIVEDIYTPVNGATSAKLEGFDYGKKYVCDLEYPDGTKEKSDVLDASYRIVHQPTAGEPYVTLNNGENAAYQWYLIEDKTETITADNANTVDPGSFDLDGNRLKSTYEDGWWIPNKSGEYESGGIYYDNYFYFEKEFKKGDVLEFEVDDSINICNLQLALKDSGGYIVHLVENKATFTVAEDGVYTLKSTEESSASPAKLKVNLKRTEETKLGDQTGNTLNNPEIGKSYRCVAVAKDSSVLKSSRFNYKYGISLQPTEKNLTASANEGKAGYQWYTVKGERKEVTDLNAEPFDMKAMLGDDAYFPESLLAIKPSEYIGSRGWNPFRTKSGDAYSMIFFSVDMLKGEKLDLEFSDEVMSVIIARNISGMYSDTYIVKGTRLSVTAEEDRPMVVAVVAEKPVYLKAYIDSREFEAVSGATSGTFVPDKVGDYACQVTFEDDTKEMSDTVKVTHICEFSGNLKFNKDKHWKECTCGEKKEISDHKYSAFTTVKAATCTAEGSEKAVCICGAASWKTTPALGHKDANGDKKCDRGCGYSYEVPHKHTVVVIPAVEATYTKGGLTEGKKCSSCGQIFTAQKETERKKLSKVSGLKTKAVKLASGTKSSLTLTWTKVEGAEKYEIQQYIKGKWKTVGTSATNSYTVKKLKAKKTYKFRVKAIAGKYYSSYSSTHSAKVVPLKTTLTLKSGKKYLTASWKSVSNITKYELQYSTSKKFSKKTTKTTKSRKLTVKKLKKGKKYYVRVRAYKVVGGKKIYSSWSSVKSVKVK